MDIRFKYISYFRTYTNHWFLQFWKFFEVAGFVWLYFSSVAITFDQFLNHCINYEISLQTGAATILLIMQAVLYESEPILRTWNTKRVKTQRMARTDPQANKFN